MVLKEKKDIKPGLKFGVALLLSLGGILYSIIKSKVMKPSRSQSPPSPPPSDSRNQVGFEGEVAGSLYEYEHEGSYLPTGNSTSGLSPSGKSTGLKDEFLLPDFDEILKEFDLDAAKARTPIKDVEPPRSDTESTGRVVDNRDDQELEIRNLRNLVKTLKERETALENKLLEYYGLKEQESTIKELRTRLKINTTEAKLFSLKIESLQADNRRLEAQVMDYRKVVADLETARAQIKLLKGKLRSEAEDNREHILALKQRVTKLQEQKLVAVESNTDIHPQLEKVKDLEKQIEVLKKSNYNLQQENSDLGQRLDHTQSATTSARENKEAALKAESQRLRKQNEELTKEVEQLQEDRCADVEELVYMRWINACLRYELRNYQPSQGKTAARDLSGTLSPKSEKKAKQLILEYANNEGLDGRGINCTEFDSDHSSSSRASYLTDSGDLDDSSVDNSSASKNNTSGRRKIFSGLIKLLRGHYPSGGSSLEVPAPTEYVVGRDSTDSPVFNDRFLTGVDGKSSKSRTSSISSTRRSLESSSRFAWDHHKPAYFQELRTESTDVASSPRDNEINRHTEKDEKANLLKYAGALMDKPGKFRRKAASFSSL